MNLSWMQWTTPTLLMVAGLFATLTVMGIWDARSPSVRRKGFLPVGFTRGERLFLSIVTFFGTMVLWLAFLPTTNLLYALPVAAVLIVLMVRWG